jgi:hypothetical protein
MWTDPGNIQIAHRQETVKIGTEAVQFPEKEYTNETFLAVHQDAVQPPSTYFCFRTFYILHIMLSRAFSTGRALICIDVPNSY